MARRAARVAPRFDAFHVYTPVGVPRAGPGPRADVRALAALARAAGRPFVPAVAPGFDDRRCASPAPSSSAPGARPTTGAGEAALSVDPAWVLVSSWNEWHEGSEIEPSVEHGRRYLDATRGGPSDSGTAADPAGWPPGSRSPSRGRRRSGRSRDTAGPRAESSGP